jgi:hypothetical protein
VTLNLGVGSEKPLKERKNGETFLVSVLTLLSLTER